MNNIGAFSYGYGATALPATSSMGNSVGSIKNNSHNFYQNNQQNSYGKNINSGRQSGADFGVSGKEQKEYNTRKQKINSGLEVTSYTDKEGRVHKTFTGKGTDVVESMKKAEEKNKDKKAKAKKHLDYSFQRVSSQVIMAKNSLSASKAVIAARRSLSDLKRKLQTVECSEDEKAAALAHATRMLRIARKKKNNLEMEELIKATMQTDERNEKFNQAAEAISGLFDDDEKKEHKEIDILDMIKGGSEEGEDKENKEAESAELSGDWVDLLDDADFEEAYDSEELSGDLEELTEETIEELADEMSKEMSEELKDMMSLMEVIDPHMNKEQFEKLKTKHRCEEQKEIVKADMEYLKAYLKSVQDGKSSGSGNDSKSVTGPDVAAAFQTGADGNNLSQMVEAGVTIATGVSDTSLGFSFGA